MAGVNEGNDGERGRRRTSAVLSLLAAVTTFLVFGLFFVTSSMTTRVWLVEIALPSVVVSLAAAVQYRWAAHSGAGAAAATVYWIFILIAFRAAVAIAPGAVLQTIAWFISRPRGARATRAEPIAS